MTPTRPSSEDELVGLVRSVDIAAPPALRANVERMLAEAPVARLGPMRTVLALARRQRDHAGARTRFEGRALGTGLAAAAVSIAVVLAVVLSSTGGARSSLSLRAAATPTLLAATAPAPRERAHTDSLVAAVGNVHFPYWAESLGWRSTGARHDTLGGRSVTTVFYAHGQARVGYAIYAVPSPRSSDGAVRTQDGTAYHVLSSNGTAIISWLRSGHLCVMSSRRASVADLIRLAAWSDGARAA
jgi:hypothetical protein